MKTTPTKLVTKLNSFLPAFLFCFFSKAKAQRKPLFLLTLSIFICQLSLVSAQTNPSTEPLAKAEKKTKPATKSASKKSAGALLTDPSAQKK